MIAEDTFAQKGRYFKKEFRLPYKKMFLYMTFVVMMSVVLLLFDVRFIENADVWYVSLFFAILFATLSVCTVYVIRKIHRMIGVEKNECTAFATIFCVFIALICGNNAQDPRILWEVFFVFFPASIGVAMTLNYLILKMVKKNC